jgi:phage terminase large subunit-like protein
MLSSDDEKATAELLELLEKHKRENLYDFFEPYAPQLEFFNMGKEKRERALLGGTQCGKTEGGAYEATCHLTGLYPKWWTGKVFEKPTRGWCAGISRELVRDGLQTKLCGIPGSAETFGTGLIPKSLLLSKTLGHGVTNAFDTISVRHVTGGVSTAGFKSYDQGREKFQSVTLDWVWGDEEADADIYSEMLGRLTGQGILWNTLTPLKGYTQFINRFLRDTSPDALRDRGFVKLGIKDAAHFTEEEKQRRVAGYPAHERNARMNGDPLLGSGSIWEEVTESDITAKIALSMVPRHWPLLWAIDFGIDHPFAAVLLTWDRDTDTIYVVDAFKMSGGIPVTHAARMKDIAPFAPVAWPHDGNDREKGSGEPLAKLYKNEGLKMLPTHATFTVGGYSTEAGIMDVLGRMRDGRFKAAAHLWDFWDEFRTYHRDEGKIVKVNDDIMSATRIGVMMIRKAQVPDLQTGFYGRGANYSNRPRQAPKLNPWTNRQDAPR